MVAFVAKDNHEYPGTPSSPSLCRARVLQRNRTAESELGTSRMNNAALNETAALWHDMVENQRHANTSPALRRPKADSN